MRICFAFLLVIMTLNACTPAPQPFRHDRTGFDPTSLRLKDGGTVMIQELEGAQPALGRMMMTQLSEELNARDIAATASKINNPAFVVEAEFVANRDHRTQNRGTIYWRFKDQAGQTLKEIIQPVRAPYQQWNLGDRVVLDPLIAQTADQFAALLQDQNEVRIAQTPVDDRVRFVVLGVQGAPGDGSAALQKAMRFTLNRFGAEVINSFEPGVYRLAGDVRVLAPFEGQQRVIIDWIVQDDQGLELGRANQNNQVPQGSLNGAWGQLAYAISQGAISGIGEIVEKHQLEMRWERSRPNPAPTAPPGRRNPGLNLPF